MTLFENVFADDIKLRPRWIRVEINSMIGIIRKKKMDTRTEGEHLLTMEVETGVV